MQPELASSRINCRRPMLTRRKSHDPKRTERHRRASLPNIVMFERRAELAKWEIVPCSDHARNTENPIRQIVDALSISPNPSKSPIQMHIGDPTTTGKMPICPVAEEALTMAVKSHKYDGYGAAVGLLEVREAVARHCSLPITADDVVLASGCSHALQMAIEALANPGDNILMPSPGFPLYSTLMRPHGIEDRHYRLDMSNNAAVDLEHIRSLIDSRTKAIIVNNPSNPTGAVFAKDQLQAILRIAHKYRIVVIADEIYSKLVYDDALFHPMATLEPKVPLISCDGIAKNYLLPGWRLGWLTIHDSHGVLAEVRAGLRNLAQKIVGPCTVIQAALPTILDETPAKFFADVNATLAANASIVYNRLSAVPGLNPIRSRGAMYAMVGVDTSLLGDEISFVQGLVAEESVYCLPGSVFGAPNWFRLVLAHDAATTEDACCRIATFADRQRLRRAAIKCQERDDDKVLSDSSGFESDIGAHLSTESDESDSP